MRVRSLFFVGLVLAAPAACAAVPSIQFDDGGATNPVDASGGNSDAAPPPDAISTADAAPDADADASVDAGCPPGYFCCMGSNIPCLGQCGPGACSKCEQQAMCKAGEYCCAANGGTVACRRLGDPCP